MHIVYIRSMYMYVHSHESFFISAKKIHHLHMASKQTQLVLKKNIHIQIGTHLLSETRCLAGWQKDGKSSDVCWQTVDATAGPTEVTLRGHVQKKHAMKEPNASHVFWFPGIRREPGAVATYRLVFGLLFAFMKENPAKFFHQSTIGLAGFKVSWMVQGFTNHDIQGELYLIWYAHQEWWLSLEMYQSWDSRVWLF